jgi:membrane-bound lytic murein transglycosylase D
MAVSAMGRLIGAGAVVLGTLACSGGPSPAPPPATAETSAPAAAVEPAQPVESSDVLSDEAGLRELAPGEDANGALAYEPTPDDPATLLHESLDAYESASAFWRQGAVDDAFAALDTAWDRMAQVPSDGDPVIAQEKENLRGLIARRVVEIYASRKAGSVDMAAAIPRIVNDEVRREIASFQGRERQTFLEGYQRSGLYRPHIVAELKKAGLPEQLSWLPLVESWYKDRALSRARALGMWQFIASTGYRYGLDRDAWIDERMDPEKSTQAAIGYLTALHDLFGDWMLALAGYNCGEHNVLKAIRRQQEGYFDQFWDVYSRLPKETRRYVPRFLATLEIVEDPAKYGFELPAPLPPVAFERVEIARATQLASLDRALGLAGGSLAKLNPELRRNATPDRPYPLKVPAGTGEAVVASLGKLPKWEPPTITTETHRVRSGETISGIASRYKTSVSAIVAANRLRNPHRLSIGQRLEIPSGSTRAAASSGGFRASSGFYVVRSGDTLGKIAARQGVPLSRLIAANRLSSGSTIYPGQRLTIPN